MDQDKYKIAFATCTIKHNIHYATLLSAWFRLGIIKYQEEKANVEALRKERIRVEEEKKAKDKKAKEEKMAKIKKMKGDEIAMPKGKAKPSHDLKQQEQIDKAHKKVQLSVEKKKPKARKKK